jgi:hypothetical protein
MSEQKATPEQWGRLEQRKLVGNDLVPAVLELRARVEALEAAANYPAKPDSSPAPACSLVERVADALCRAQLDSPSWEPEARAAIREVAAWFRRGDAGAGSAWTVAADVLDAVLREEADRSTSQED